MIQDSIFVELKSGQQIEIRSPQCDEAQATLSLMVEIASHSPYILSTPETFKKRDLNQQVTWIQDSEKSESSIILAAYDRGQMVGFSNGRGYQDIKRKHRAGLGISILPQYRSSGLGRKMMEVLLANMKKFSGVRIIELDVMTNNIPAVKMYEGLGFQRAGIFPNAFILPSGEVSDNLTMYLEVEP